MKKLIIEQMKHLIKLLESKTEYEMSKECGSRTRAEVKRKMHELRRDSIAYEKHLYAWESRKNLEGYPNDR